MASSHAAYELAITLGGGESFIHKGTNGRWKDVLSALEIDRCDEEAARHLTAECARWVKTGVLPRRRPPRRKRPQAQARAARRRKTGRRAARAR